MLLRKPLLKAWRGAASRSALALLLALAVALSSWPKPAEAAHGNHTLNLHAADVVVGSTTYNTENEGALSGTLATASGVLPQNVEVTLVDAAGISIFASDAVPTGTTWNISGSWTFNPYIRTSIASRGWVRARVYRISTSGTATQVLYTQNGTRYNTTTSYQLMSWAATVPTGTVLQPGERFGVAFFFLTDRSDSPTGYLGFDHTSAPSNVSARYLAGVARQAHYRIGQDTTLAAMTWYAATDTAATSIPQSTNFRVRFQVYNNGAGARSWQPQLEWSATSGSGYAAVPLTSGATPFFVADTAQFTNGDVIGTGNFALGTGTGTAQAGVAYDTQNPPAAITLNAASYTEIEFNIQANSNATLGASYYFRLTDNGTALTAYDIAEAQITILLPGNARQSHYRIGQDTALAAMTWYAATDTAATGIPQSTNFRVRFQVYNNGTSNKSWAPRLEWTATSGSGYAAVPTVSGATPFFVSDTAQFTNGDAIGTGNFALGTGTGTAQAGVAYDTQNPPAAITLNAASYTEIEFNIQANSNATQGASYYFRLTDNGTALTAYDIAEAQITILLPGNARQAHYRIGQDTALAAMTWYAATDTAATGIPQSTNFRVRFQVYNSGGVNKSWAPRLEWSATSGSGYAALPTVSGATPFFVADTAQFTNGDVIGTGNFALGTGTGTAQAGVAYDTQNPPAAITLNAASYTEIEFNIQANSNATQGASYYFRLTDNGAALTSYDIAEAQITIQAVAGTLRQAHYRIGQDTALAAMTWYANADTLATGIPQSTNFRVRFQVYNNGGSNKSWTPQLEWTATSGSGYAAVPTVSGATPFFVADTAQFTNAAAIATGNFALGAGTGTAQAGVAYDTANPAGAALTLNATSYTEIEFNIQANSNATQGASYYFRLTDNGAALTSYDVLEAQTRIQTAGVLREAHYRIGQDATLTAMTWYAAADTAASAIPQNTNFRVRFQVYNNGEQAIPWTPRLEWTATAGSGYAAVPTVSGATPFFVADTAQFTNGDVIGAPQFGLGTGTGTAQAGLAYDTANPAGAALTLNATSYTEIEFNLQANSNATLGTSYYFRFTNNGVALTAYETTDAQITMQAPVSYVRSDHYRIGRDDALAAMTWYASTDTAATALPRTTNFRVRFQLYNDGNTGATWTPQLEWSATAGSGYAAVPLTSGASPFFISNTTQFANGDAVTTANFGLGTGVGTAQNGIAYDTANPAGAALTLNASSYTEVEFSAQANSNASEGASYYFRLTNNGTALTAYENPTAEVVVLTAPTPTPTPGPPAHNFSQPYAADTSACAACHRAHTSTAPTSLEKQWPEEQVCYTCHDGTGAPNIMAQFAKTYKMPITSTQGVHSLAEWRNKSPSQFSGANRHVECVDCHNPHYAAAGNHTVGSAYAFGPQQGVWGVTPSYTAAWSTPSFVTTNRITYQYELCFKCHSSWAFGTNPPTVPSGGFPETDVAKEFNPLNASFMPVMAQGKNPFRLWNGTSYASSLIGGFTPTSRMVCSDCHGSDNDTDPKGPHGSTNPFILRGTWDRTTGQTGTSNHLCFKCHTWNVYGAGGSGSGNSTGFSGGGSNLHTLMVGARNKAYNDNPIVCMDCHVAIPHGYYRDHLIGYTGDGSPYINRPYAGGLTTINTWQASGQWTFNSCSTAMNNCR